MQLRNFFILILVLIFSAGYAQQTSNRFEEEDARLNQNEVDNAEPFKDELPQGPGNPGEPVPINGYIPVLILTAVGIIMYRNMQKNAS
ncbi:hypothetical protein [Chryseobacterium sp. MP_3.2]|uniref:hypothetical protein n=1 Tax=Chryseobacterium sp. MP_3.2 TaxID=3071712 RepID=UPI002DF95A5E|nr:hypothetical protein [Chryseobacterium sp. MP_3.2]